MHVGFTGTRDKLTVVQADKLESLLKGLYRKNDDDWFHHGDCVGADAAAHYIAKKVGYRIWLHPASNNLYRAFCELSRGTGQDRSEMPVRYAKRNVEIVNKCDILLACPNNYVDIPRGSGTWQTVRMAIKLNRNRILIFPDGTTTESVGSLV